MLNAQLYQIFAYKLQLHSYSVIALLLQLSVAQIITSTNVYWDTNWSWSLCGPTELKEELLCKV